MDKDIVKEFWRKRALTGHTRWTGDGMLAFDQALLRPLVGDDTRILDLGSGFGELSRSICGPGDSLVAVDQEPGMAAGFEGDDRFAFVHSSVVDYVPEGRFDLVLLFGVITHLTEEEEEAVYSVIVSALATAGVAVIKNQCSDGADLTVDTYSEALGASYVGRYPSVESQRSRLARRFGSVEIVEYPPELKMHRNSSHVAFVCREPR
ncbi:MAG TPA: class I SAM-dependent methyltransferase [Lacisediminihabitans sp.]|uniref:class I SAM-dependent methyltransferase n=1 Tax=Lacisediminihabitans sp. TaxID=2787631 RepID=UPI002ED8ED1C